jgi:hypothetical protein
VFAVLVDGRCRCWWHAAESRKKAAAVRSWIGVTFGRAARTKHKVEAIGDLTAARSDGRLPGQLLAFVIVCAYPLKPP